jgi:outer membrane murein-binding lipoprotein Lpp
MMTNRTVQFQPNIQRKKMKNTIKLTLAASAVVLLAGCATPTVTQVVKPGDTGLSCAQMQNEFSDVQRLKKEADAEKTVTGGNVVRALLFWPAIIGTAMNANEAIAAADNRTVHLSNLMSQIKCEIPK